MVQAKKNARKPRVNPVRAVVVYLLGMGMILAGVYYSSLTPVGPLPEALSFLNSTGKVQITNDQYAYFQPLVANHQTGFIFYPGGRVDYRSYAPLAARLAEKGWPVAIVPMPLNLAVLGSDRADSVINSHSEIKNWVIGGHSLGGTMAARYTIENPEDIAGIIFLASYPSDTRLAESKLPVFSIYASEDGVISTEDWQKYRARFPTGTTWVEIIGGNHAGFGWYGIQADDRPAVISLNEQTEQILQAIDQFLTKVENNK